MKDIKNYEGLYSININGEVTSHERKVLGKDGSLYPIKSKILKPSVNKQTGYKVVSLWKGNKGSSKVIHRLLAQAFIPNPDNLPVINHIDGNKLNNSLDNLEWCTHKHNLIHAVETGLRTYNRSMDDQLLEECLNCVIRGESITNLSRRVPYQTPWLSTQLRDLAVKLNLESELQSSLDLQKTNRNKIANTNSREVVRQYSKDGEFIREHISITAAARYLGKKSSGTISNALNLLKSQKTAYGFIWKRV